MKDTYKINFDRKEDAWNWWNGCNVIFHGVDRTVGIDAKVVKKIRGKSKKAAFDFLIPYLENKYKNEKDSIIIYKEFVESQFEKKFQKGCEKIIKSMGKPLYRSKFIFYLTTFDRAPYNKEKGAVWLPVTQTDPMGVFLHELCHFQFIHYWRENPRSAVAKLTFEQFDYLKESLTMILNKDFLPIINKPDRGYDMHKKFRQELSKFYAKNKNFDSLVQYGAKIVTKYV